MPKLVLDLKDRRPAWSMPPWVSQEIEAALPEGWILQVMDAEADGTGDGMANLGPALLEAIRDAEIYLGYGVPADLLREGGKLRWVHSGAAGVRGSLTPEMLASTVLFTNSKGIHGPPMGDTAMAMILYFARGLDFAVANQRRGVWDTDPFLRSDHPLVEIAQSTVGLLGFGGAGREVAKRAMALGARVLAYDRGPEAFGGKGGAAGSAAAEVLAGILGPGSPTKSEGVPGRGGERALSASELLHGAQGFARLLEESDFLVLTAPETPQTRGMVDPAALARMKRSAVLVNLSRGALVDEDALVAALTEGRLRGAGLDVFATEPLPPGHPFWSLPNVVLTPHVSAVSRSFWRRQTDLILENLRRFVAGESLVNLVDKEAGF
jgi:phosphoglycerate dehydrogenase-like enzyme